MCVRNKIWVAKKHPKCLSITGCLFFLHYENIFLGHFLFNFSPYGSAPNQGISSSIFFSLFVSMSSSFSRRYVMYFSESSPFMTALLRTENMLADAWTPLTVFMKRKFLRAVPMAFISRSMILLVISIRPSSR